MRTSLLLAFLLAPVVLAAQTQPRTTFDTSVAPGANYDKAEFRLWLPPGDGAIRAVVALVPGSNGDGRPMVVDTVWQQLATKHRLALVGVRFTDKPHEQSFIEEYIAVSRGSGQAFLDGLSALGALSKHPEVGTAPLFMWGMSAGGQFNYEFVAWKPERVAAFVVNKGGIYYSALLSQAARNVPGLLFVGGKDLAFRTNTIVGLFAVNRRGGALWALTEEPGAAHVVGRSRDFGAMFFEDLLPMRIGEDGNLKPVAERDGYFGDLQAKTITLVGTSRAPNYPTAWLPTQRTANAWLAVVTDRPW